MALCWVRTVEAIHGIVVSQEGVVKAINSLSTLGGAGVGVSAGCGTAVGAVVAKGVVSVESSLPHARAVTKVIRRMADITNLVRCNHLNFIVNTPLNPEIGNIITAEYEIW